MVDLLNDKMKEYKEKEAHTLATIKQEYEIKVKAFREKYKDLETKDFKYLESEYARNKEKLETDFNAKIKDLESMLRSNHDRLRREVNFNFY